MTTLQPGTKVLIEATVISQATSYAALRTKSGERFAIRLEDLTVCETAEVATPNMQQIEVGDVVRKLNTKLGVNSILKIPRPQPSEPIPTPSFKAGQEVEWTNHSIWHKGHYVGKTRDGKYVVEVCDTVHSCVIVGENAIRPVPAQPTVESELRELYEAAKATDNPKAWIPLATAWHQKHSSRVEVNVPTKEEIVKYWKELPEGSDAVIDTVIHFMTRKEAKDGN